MPSKLYAYTGKLLRVNLTTRQYRVEEIPDRIRAEYIGGRGFTAKYCYDEIQPGTDPLGPENKIIFANGPLSGTRMPASGRYVVGTLSPLTRAYIRSVSGGAWGAFLKFAGYDLLIIEGAAAQWCYLYIHSDGVEFRDASHLLGKLTEDTEAAICEELGNPKARSCVIGPSGEKRVRHACIQTERRSAGRGGIGAVMGAKKLKGISVYGKRKPVLYDKKAFNERIKAHVRTNAKCDYYHHFHSLGTTGGVGLTYSLGVHPVKNFQKGLFPEIEQLYPEAINALGLKKRDTGCWNCYMQCGSTFDVPDGPFKGEDYENPEYETMWSFGANCLNSEFRAILKANRICDDYGADTISTGNAVAFLMECYDRGYIDAEDLNGVELRWGDPVAMLEVARQIVNRESKAGNWIADGGVRNAAEQIGQDSADFAIHSKGMELAAYDPRGIQAHGLGYATSTIGGSHQIGYSVHELFGYPEQIDRFSTKDKGEPTIWANRFITIFDCAVACGFPNAFTESKLDITSFLDWLQLATGMTTAFHDEAQMNGILDRIYNVERAFNLRMGVGVEEDTLPRRILETSIEDGPSAGHIWHREELLSDYYEKRQWDLETGIPKRSLLEALNLTEIADDLEKLGHSGSDG